MHDKHKVGWVGRLNNAVGDVGDTGNSVKIALFRTQVST